MRITHAATAAALLALGAGASTASADVISQTLTFDYDFLNSIDPYDLPFQGFDNQGGTLRLDEIRFVWEGTYEFDYRLENTGPTSVAVDDFFLNLEYNALHVYGPNNGSPFYVPSGLYEYLQHDLAANDNAPGGADEYADTRIVPYTNTVVRDRANFPQTFHVLNTPGEIYTSLGGFGGLGFFWVNEPVGWDPPSGIFGEPIYPDDDAIWIFWTDSRHHGSLTVEYEYSVVPAPGGVGLLACGLVCGLRRRR